MKGLHQPAVGHINGNITGCHFTVNHQLAGVGVNQVNAVTAAAGHPLNLDTVNLIAADTVIAIDGHTDGTATQVDIDQRQGIEILPLVVDADIQRRPVAKHAAAAGQVISVYHHTTATVIADIAQRHTVVKLAVIVLAFCHTGIQPVPVAVDLTPVKNIHIHGARTGRRATGDTAIEHQLGTVGSINHYATARLNVSVNTIQRGSATAIQPLALQQVQYNRPG